MVMLAGENQKPVWAVEVKWSDRYCTKPDELQGLIGFCRANKLNDALVTSKTQTITCKMGDTILRFVPASVYCYTVGYNIIRGRKSQTLLQQLEIDPKDSTTR